MAAIQLKDRLIELINKEGDERLLELVHRLLDRSTSNTLRSQMIERTMRGEEDIAAGRVLSVDEARKRVNEKIRGSK